MAERVEQAAVGARAGRRSGAVDRAGRPDLDGGGQGGAQPGDVRLAFASVKLDGVITDVGSAVKGIDGAKLNRLVAKAHANKVKVMLAGGHTAMIAVPLVSSWVLC